jgi:hypothetical protein
MKRNKKERKTIWILIQKWYGHHKGEWEDIGIHLSGCGDHEGRNNGR